MCLYTYKHVYQEAGGGTVEPLPVRAGLPTGGCSGMQPCVQRWVLFGTEVHQ